MNKEEAKKLIESESLIRQEAKAIANKREHKVSNSKFSEDVIHIRDEPENSSIEDVTPETDEEEAIRDKLQSELYVEAKYQNQKYVGAKAKVKKVESKDSIFFTDSHQDRKYDVTKKPGEITKRKFDNKRSIKFEAKEVKKTKAKKSDQKFKASEDAIGDIISTKRRANTKFTEKELRQKAYFLQKLQPSNEFLIKSENVNVDEVTVKKQYKKNHSKLSNGSSVREQVEGMKYATIEQRPNEQTYTKYTTDWYTPTEYSSSEPMPIKHASDGYMPAKYKQSKYAATNYSSVKYQVSEIMSFIASSLNSTDDKYKEPSFNGEEEVKEIQDTFQTHIVEKTPAKFINNARKSVASRKYDVKSKGISSSKYEVTAKSEKKIDKFSSVELLKQDTNNQRKYRALKKKEEQIFFEMKNDLAKKIVSKIKEVATRNKIGIIVATIFVVMALSTLSAVGIVVKGVADATGSYLTGLSLSTDFDMTDTENYFTKKEMELQEVLDDIETYYPGYDKYDLDVDPIGHDSLKLMAYLSAVYEGYDLNKVSKILDSLFDDMYVITVEEKAEIENNHQIKVLSLTLTKTEWDELMASRIDDKNKDLYDSYEGSGGGHQSFHNPFSINWTNKITSEFGWRIHPITGEEKFHRGVDIAMPSGTPVMACSEGVVVKSEYSDVEGNYVVVEDETGYRCSYMHLSERSVSVGDVVDYDTLIGRVGSTGRSTGPHLHLQVTDNTGELLNPKFMVQGGY